MSTPCTELLKVVGDETRFRVMAELNQGPKTVGELAHALQVEQSLLSHHLKILRDHELVLAKRVGKSVVYETTRPAFDLGCCRIDFAKESK